MTKNISLVSVFALIVFAVVWFSARKMDLVFLESSIMTGYTLFSVILFVALFNIRKKLSMIPLAKASTWLVFHVAGGLLCIALFWLHTKTLWPRGVFEGFFAASFYLVSLSGIAGYILQRVNARKLTDTGIEVIYERVPAELAEIRERVEEIVVECTENTGSDILANHYLDTLSWYFRKPRFYISSVFGLGGGGVWLRTKAATVKRYLSDEELAYFNQIEDLANLKLLVDVHYSHQDLNKKWLLVHLPLSVAMLVMVLWHLLLVEVYAT